MKKEYLSARLNKDIFYKRNEIYLKRRVFFTFKNLIKTFYNQDIKSFKEILDLGAGDKSFVKVVKENGINCRGLDVDEIDLENEKINYEDCEFDLVTGISLIEHIFNPSNFLKESYRVLKKDRWIYYTGKADPEVYEKEPFNLNILKADIDKFLDADGALNVCHLKVKAQEEKLNLLTDQVKSIMNVSFNIGNAIKWKKFLNGELG